MAEEQYQNMTKDELVALLQGQAKAEGKPAPTGDDVVTVVRDAVKETMAKQIADLSGATERVGDMAKQMSELKAEAAARPTLPLARKIRMTALAAIEGGKGDDPEFVKHQVKRYWGPIHGEDALKFLDYQIKTTHTAHDAVIAGDIVQPQYSPEWIDYLRPMTTIRQIATTEPMPRGAMSVRKQTGATTAYYQGETDTATQSNVTVGREQMSYKKLVALSVVSNDLIRFSGSEADRMILEDLRLQAAQREDIAFLTGNPPTDAGSPKGIPFWTDSANRFQNAGTALTNFQSDVGIAASYIGKAHIPMDGTNTYLLMNHGTWWKILSLTTSLADTAWAATVGPDGQRRFMGFPVMVTSQLNEDATAVTACFETALSQTYGGAIYVVHAPSLRIYDSYNLTTAVYPGGAYYNGTSVASGISNDETVLTAISEHDFYQKYPKASAIIMNYNL